jgi:ABC-type transport system substrate-binding protein
VRGTSASIAVLSSAALLACASTKKQSTTSNAGRGAEQPQPGGTFNTYVNGNPGILDPMAGASASSGIVTSNVYASLFRLKTSTDPRTALNEEPESSLGTTIESPDGITWTIKLRTDAVFHNLPPVSGHPVTSADVKASFQRAFATPNNSSLISLAMVDPDQITTPAPDTVVFKLKRAYGHFENVLAPISSGQIMPREAYAGSYDPAKVVIGSGPFMLDSYQPDVAVTLKRFPGWFEKGQPYVDSVRAAVIADSSQQLAQFSAGHVDDFEPTSQNLATATQSNPKAAVLSVPSGDYKFTTRMDRPTPFSDVNVRRAFSMALDRKAMAGAVFGKDWSNNGVVPASLGNVALLGDQLGNSSKWWQYNPSEAKKLIEATPAIKQLRRFLYPTPNYGRDFETLMQTVVSMLNAVGLRLQAVPIDYIKDFIGGGKGAVYGNYPDDSLLGSIMLSSGDVGQTFHFYYEKFDTNTHNGFRVSDPKFDAMLVNLDSIVASDAYFKAAQDIQRYLAEQLYYIPLPGGYDYTLVQPWVANYQYAVSTGVFADGSNTLSRLWVKGH